VLEEALAVADGECTGERGLDVVKLSEPACVDTLGDVTAGGTNVGCADLGEDPAETLLMLLLACMMGVTVDLGEIWGVTAFGEIDGDGEVSLCNAWIAPTLRFGDNSL